MPIASEDIDICNWDKARDSQFGLCAYDFINDAHHYLFFCPKIQVSKSRRSDLGISSYLSLLGYKSFARLTPLQLCF